MTRHHRIDLSGRRGGNSLPLCLLLALAPALIGCFPAVSYPLGEQMKRAFHVWPALCWQFFTLLSVAAYLTAAGILCARARATGACAAAAALGLVLLPALALVLPGTAGAFRMRLLFLFVSEDFFGIALLGQLILAVYLLARWLRYR